MNCTNWILFGTATRKHNLKILTSAHMKFRQKGSSTVARTILTTQTYSEAEDQFFCSPNSLEIIRSFNSENSLFPQHSSENSTF